MAASDSEATLAASGTDTETESCASSRTAEANRRRKERKKASKKALAAQRSAAAAVLAGNEEPSAQNGGTVAVRTLLSYATTHSPCTHSPPSTALL